MSEYWEEETEKNGRRVFKCVPVSLNVREWADGGFILDFPTQMGTWKMLEETTLLEAKKEAVRQLLFHLQDEVSRLEDVLAALCEEVI